LKRSYYAYAAVIVFFGLVALLVLRASAAHARTQAVLQVMSDMNQAQNDCTRQDLINTNLPAPARSSSAKFNIHLFKEKLIALDRSKCPADFQAAYDEWLKAVEAAETYSTTNNAVDVLALFRANGNAQALAIINQLKQTQSNLRKAAQRYGVTIADQ
jgi:hypothetical protein